MIRFENDAEKATAPAAIVRITQTLDSDLDFNSFRLGTFGFGDFIISGALGLSSFEARLDYRESFGIFIDVSAGIDVATGEAFWELRSIDPVTGEVPFSPLIGFLPPNVDGVEGQGYVTYSIRPKTTVESGDVIDAKASIIFDQNEPIETPPIFNTIDAGGPTSQVEVLAAQNVPGFLVKWTGSDDANGSGVRNYDVYVSENGGAFQLWLDDAAVTEARYVDAVPGNTYAFYSVATDLVGHREAAPATADAQTLAIEPQTTSVVSIDVIQTPQLKISVKFADPMAIQSMLSGSVMRQAMQVLHYVTGPVDLTNWEFDYDSATRTLILSTPDQLAGGTYELRLDGSQFKTEAGVVLRGGASGLVFEIPGFKTADTVKVGGVDLAVNGDSSPIIVDWNADGRSDLVVGERIAGNQAKVRIYLNRGTNSTPAYDGFFYAQTTTGELTVPAASDFGVVPRMVDWNGDGEADLLLGLADGRIQLWTNVNTSQQPVFGVPRYLSFGSSDASAISDGHSEHDGHDHSAESSTDAPSCGCGVVVIPEEIQPPQAQNQQAQTQQRQQSIILAATVVADVDAGSHAGFDVVDWNNDGLLDLVVGGTDGRIQVFLHYSTEEFDFSSPQTLLLGAGTLVVPGGSATLDVVDLNGDGRKDIVAGNREGQAILYLNEGWDAEPEFRRSYALQASGASIDLEGQARSQPFVADYDSDGLLDLLLGSADGKVRLFKGAVDASYPPTVLTIAGGTYAHAFELIDDSTPPQVESIAVSSTSWAPGFVHSSGYQLSLTGQPSRLPWTGVNQIKVTFSEDVTVSQDSLWLRGVNVADYQISSFTYDAATHTGVWTLSAPIQADKLVVSVGGNVSDPLGNPLQLKSVRFDVLPGDADLNGSTAVSDVGPIRGAMGTQAGDSLYNAMADIDGSGAVSVVDIGAFRQFLGLTLPAGEPTAWMTAAVTSKIVQAPAMIAFSAINETPAISPLPAAIDQALTAVEALQVEPAFTLESLESSPPPARQLALLDLYSGAGVDRRLDAGVQRNARRDQEEVRSGSRSTVCDSAFDSFDDAQAKLDAGLLRIDDLASAEFEDGSYTESLESSRFSRHRLLADVR